MQKTLTALKQTSIVHFKLHKNNVAAVNCCAENKAGVGCADQVVIYKKEITTASGIPAEAPSDSMYLRRAILFRKNSRQSKIFRLFANYHNCDYSRGHALLCFHRIFDA